MGVLLGSLACSHLLTWSLQSSSPSSWWPQSTPRLWLRPRPLLTLTTDTTDTTGSPTDTLDTATTDTATMAMAMGTTAMDTDTGTMAMDMVTTTARGRLMRKLTTAMDTMAMDMDTVTMVMDMDTGTMAMDIMDTSTDKEPRVEDSAEIRLSFNRNIYVEFEINSDIP